MRALRWFSLAAFATLAMVAMAHAENQIPWQTNLETAQILAGRTNRLVLIHFWAPWCKPCARLETEVFSRVETARALDANYVMVKLNFDEAPGTARNYGVSSLPTDVIITPSGRLVSAIQSPPTAGQYITQMNQAAAGHRELARQAQVGAVQTQQMGTPHGYPPSAGAPANGPQAPPANVLVANNSTVPPSGAPQSPYQNDRYAEYFNNQQQQPAQQAPGYAPPGAAPASPQMAAPVAPGYPPQQQQQPPQVGAPNPASQAAVYQPQPQQPQIQLPPGSPPLGLDGYCPVTVVERTQWALGDKAWGVVHRGRTYLFLGPEEQKKFWANPDLYSPVLSGNDPVLALDRQVVVPGRREFGVFLDKRIYLFSNEQSRQLFEQNPKRYAAEVLQAMR